MVVPKKNAPFVNHIPLGWGSGWGGALAKIGGRGGKDKNAVMYEG